ncbi:MAG: dihydropteroate synthase [Bacteroidota bacterium]|nr:dihydropteroate synthase [Bacteroidota bacterium]
MIFQTNKTLNLKGKLIDLSTPIVMGILNITPDSFYDGGKYLRNESIISKAKQMLEEGATIVDVGGYSTRPGASVITEDEEIKRVIPIIDLLNKEFKGINISVDTFRPNVAEAAIQAGACMVNDVTGGGETFEMYDILKKYKVAYVLMHSRGNPQTMTQLTDYKDIITDIVDYFVIRINKLKTHGILDIIIDPGFGFAKNINQNYHLLKNLSYLKSLNCAILVGLSRKSMIYKQLNINAVESLNGTSILHTLALQNGASILRVHDVKEAMEAIKLVEQYNRKYNE